MFLFCLVFAMSLCASVYMCFVVTCWERADLLALVCGVYCEFVTFPLVSWVRCGTWLHRFLIFAPLLTLLKDHNTVTPVSFEPAASRSRVKHSITEPLRSLNTLYVYAQRLTCQYRGSVYFLKGWIIRSQRDRWCHSCTAWRHIIYRWVPYVFFWCFWNR